MSMPEDNYGLLGHSQQEGGANSAKALQATRKRHLLAGISLAVSLLAFTVQTEAAGRMAANGYMKPVFMLYATHSSWWMLYPLETFCEWAFFRWQKMSLTSFWHHHLAQTFNVGKQIAMANKYSGSPYLYFRKVSTQLALALNVAGLSWYIAVNWTTVADLTAIYNCSALFVYAFSIPLLHEAWNPLKGVSVAISIIGVLVVAYGGGTDSDTNIKYPNQLKGNIIIGVGAILYGLYEVLYKKIASPPQSVSAKKQAVFATAMASMIGIVNMLGLWPFLIVFHFTGIETFQLPTGKTALLAALSVVSNMVFSGSFLALMSLTSPVLGSVAGLLTTFIVPLTDYLFFGHTIGFWGIIGGLIIIAAFGLMSWATWAEMQEDGDDDADD